MPGPKIIAWFLMKMSTMEMSSQLQIRLQLTKCVGCVAGDMQVSVVVCTPESNLFHFVSCMKERKRWYWTKEIQKNPLIHFRAGDKEWRLLTHFYGFFHFTNPAVENYYKRFVRDFLHYHDTIFCAAGKIIKAVQAEGIERGFSVDDEGSGGFSALHIRRGEFQVS